MKISNAYIRDLMNPKFCTLEEAISYAEVENKEAVWLFVIQRADIEIEKAFEIACNLGFESTWKVVIANTKFPLIDAAETAMRVSHELWPVLLSRPDVNLTYALTVARSRFHSVSVWKVVFFLKGLKPKAIIKLALEENRIEIWDCVMSSSLITQYFENMAFKEILKIAKKSNYSALWLMAMQKAESEPKGILLCAKNSKSKEAMSAAVNGTKVSNYIMMLSKKDVMILVEEIDIWQLWERVLLSRTDLSPDFVFLHLKEVNDDRVWTSVLERKEVAAYIKALPPTYAIKLAKQINHWRIWRIISQKENLKSYLLNFKLDKALKLALSCDSKDIRNYVLKKEDVKVIEIIDSAWDIMSYDDWKLLSQRKDFNEYIKGLNDESILKLACLSDNLGVWSELFGRESLSPAQVISYAKKSEDENVWNIARIRPDVKKHLSS